MGRGHGAIDFDEESFARDWALGQSLKVMAALYGFTNINSVTRQARRLGLPSRRGGPKPSAPTNLKDGEWVTVKGVSRWVKK